MNILAFFMLMAFFPALAQKGSLEMAANTITEVDMAWENNLLSYDSLAGRNTSGQEIENTASYLANRFREMGLKPAGEKGTFIYR